MGRMALAGVLLLFGSSGPAPAQNRPVELIFLDVERGDSIVVPSPEGKDALIGSGDEFRGLPVRSHADNGIPHTTTTYRGWRSTLIRSHVTYLGATSLATLRDAAGDVVGRHAH